MVLRRGAVFKYPLCKTKWCCFSRKYSVAPLGSQSGLAGLWGSEWGRGALDYHTHNSNTEEGPPCFGLTVGILIVCHCTPLNNIIPYLIIIAGLHHRILPTTKGRKTMVSRRRQPNSYLPLDGLQCTRGREMLPDKDAASLLTLPSKTLLLYEGIYL